MATHDGRKYRFVTADGTDVTGTDDVVGYSVADFFDCDFRNASDAELLASYKGPDSDGISVVW